MVAFSAVGRDRPPRLRRELQPLAARRQRRGGQQGQDRAGSRSRPGRVVQRHDSQAARLAGSGAEDGGTLRRDAHHLSADPATPCRRHPCGTCPRRAPSDTYVLAVDLGTGGPKVAVDLGHGRIAAHAFEKVPLALGADGAAEQTPEDWWGAIVAAARRALAESGVTPEKIVGVGCTAQWSGTVAVDADGRGHRPLHHLAGLARRDGGAARRARHAERPGLLGRQGRQVGAAHGRHPEPLGQGPGGPHPLPARGAPGRLRRHRGLPRAGRLPRPCA